MFRRTAATFALSTAGLLALAPLAHADDGVDGVGTDDTDVAVLNNLTVPVQACGTGLPILADVLGPDDAPSAAAAAPQANCTTATAPTAAQPNGA